MDLAGSERIYRSAGDDRSRREGRHINLSLHYLEQVIVALQQRARGRRPHIPYRNSTMTSVLRDSLGGNCRTVFVATLNAERDFTEETLSTCRFAQRCSSLLQEVRVNEEVDVSLLLKRMQRENKRLKQQLRAAPRPDPARQLTAEERTVCRSLVDAFVADSRAEATMRVQDMAQAEHCFALLRSHVRRAADAAGGTAQGEVEAAYRQCEALEGAGARLRQLVEGAQQEIRDLRRRAHDAGVALPHSSTLSARVPTIPPRETAVAAQGGRAKAASSPVHASIQLVRSKRFSRRTSHTRGGRGAEEGVTEGQRPGQEVVQESHHRQSAPPPHTDRAGAPTVSGPDQAVPPASEGADTASWSPRGKRGLLASMLQSQLLGGARSGGGEAVVEEEEEAGTPVARLESDDGTAETESHDEQEQQEQQEAVEDEDEGEGKGKGEPTPMGGASTGEEASSAGAMGAAPAGTLPPHLAWARASALPEADLVRALRPRDANALTALLRRGGVFVKHGRRGSPHPRFVWCDEACEEVMWRRVGGRRARGRIRLADVLGVVTGQHTRVRRWAPVPARSAALHILTPHSFLLPTLSRHAARAPCHRRDSSAASFPPTAPQAASLSLPADAPLTLRREVLGRRERLQGRRRGTSGSARSASLWGTQPSPRGCHRPLVLRAGRGPREGRRQWRRSRSPPQPRRPAVPRMQRPRSGAVESLAPRTIGRRPPSRGV